MSSMIEWAEREVKIACQRERGREDNDGEWDYGCACYESVLKAFKSLCEDEHSGMSFSIAKQILNRLMNGNPLTPIEDTPDVWTDVSYRKKCKSYQCKRMTSLFKDVLADGTVKYHDTERVVCYELSVNDNCIEGVKNPVPFYNGYMSNLIHDMFPITMPYIPDSKPYSVYVQEFLYDENAGDYDTIGIMYAHDPNGKNIPIQKYLKESGDSFVEINEAEYKVRKLNRVKEKK